MPQGTVRWFDTDRGFGFLAPEDGSPDVFVHASEVVTDTTAQLHGQMIKPVTTCAARKVVAAGQAACLYSLISPPRMRVRSTAVLGSCAAAGCC